LRWPEKPGPVTDEELEGVHKSYCVVAWAIVERLRRMTT
jgi:hypothetical protein